MPEGDDRWAGQDPQVHSSGHARRMRELEEELEVARRQAEIEKARAEAVVSHLVVENHELRRQGPAIPAQQSDRKPRRNTGWMLAGRLAASVSSMLLGLLSCVTFLLFAVLVWAYWPEISGIIFPPNQ
ncbi:hypothetical protein KDL29_03190 [bacterium]|nr:hypothetical protein [bacterium]